MKDISNTVLNTPIAPGWSHNPGEFTLRDFMPISGCVNYARRIEGLDPQQHPDMVLFDMNLGMRKFILDGVQTAYFSLFFYKLPDFFDYILTNIKPIYTTIESLIK